MAVVLRAGRSAAERATMAVLCLMAAALTEAALLALAVLILCAAFLRREPPFGRRLEDLLVVAAIPLIRIDASVVPALPVAWLLLRRRPEAWAAGAALAAGIACQIGLMLRLFGEPFSVAALLKIERAGGLFAQIGESLAASPAQAVRVVLVLALAAFALAALRAAPDAEERGRRLVLLAGVLAFLLPHLVLARAYGWYFLPVHAGLLYLAAGSLPAAARGRRLRLAGAALAALLALAYVAGTLRYQLRYLEDQLDNAAFAAAIGALTAPQDRIFQIDGSGFTGFFSGRSIVNGDGLMNSHDYRRRLGAGALGGYLEEMRICHVVTNRTPLSAELLLAVGGLAVRRDEAELLLATPNRSGNPNTNFALYRLTRPGC